MSVQGTIKLGKHTEGHGAWLRAHGYEVEDQVGRILVIGSEFVEKIDLSQDSVEAIKKVIAAKQLLTYGTIADIGNGKIRKSIMLCGYLGPVSALIVKPVGTAKVATPSPFATL